MAGRWPAPAWRLPCGVAPLVRGAGQAVMRVRQQQALRLCPHEAGLALKRLCAVRCACHPSHWGVCCCVLWPLLCRPVPAVHRQPGGGAEPRAQGSRRHRGGQGHVGRGLGRAALSSAVGSETRALFDQPAVISFTDCQMTSHLHSRHLPGWLLLLRAPWSWPHCWWSAACPRRCSRWQVGSRRSGQGQSAACRLTVCAVQDASG